MKRIILSVLLLTMISAAAAGAAEGTAPDRKPKIIVLATGGTIAGTGDPGKVAGYDPGTLTAETLLRGVPEISEVADVETIQVCNVNSDDMTSEIWLTLAGTINRMAADPEVAGFVITHRCAPRRPFRRTGR